MNLPAGSTTAPESAGASSAHHAGSRPLLGLAIGALGIVYGDIGTSPLYTIKECFHGIHAVAPTDQNVHGVLSLIFWSLTVVISVKYITFILRADNRGEGGMFALLALVLSPGVSLDGRRRAVVVLLGLFGAGLLCGEGIITPSISVLSAIEGLEVATTAAEPFVVPLTCVVLATLFAVQRHGTGGISRIFGPVMLAWFASLALLGVARIAGRPGVVAAVNPLYALDFFVANRLAAFVVLGSVVLCITGGEALYADLGHFGRKPIQRSWTYVVFPALLLNYFGQGALLLDDPEAAASPFFALVPRLLLVPMVGLATAATVIASQALISGTFSMVRQAVLLGYLPRMNIVHTSGEAMGQIYIPTVNWAMMVLCIGLVLTFGESSRLAAAYGIAVTATMAITSSLFYLVATRKWNMPAWKAGALVTLFLAFDLTYFSSNLLKLFDGGWFPLVVGTVLLTVMTTWKAGRAELGRRIKAGLVPLEAFLKDVARQEPHRVGGTAVFLFSEPDATPPAMLHHLKHNQTLHEQVVVLAIRVAEVPVVPPAERLEFAALNQGFYRIVARFGFMETPSVPEILRQAQLLGLRTDPAKTSFYLGRETLLTTGRSRMMRWRKELFAFISRNARPATDYFGLPPGRVVELGMQIRI